MEPMIVQTAREEAPRFLILMAEHTVLSDRFAAAFGNDDFEEITAPETRFFR